MTLRWFCSVGQALQSGCVSDEVSQLRHQLSQLQRQLSREQDESGSYITHLQTQLAAERGQLQAERGQLQAERGQNHVSTGHCTHGRGQNPGLRPKPTAAANTQGRNKHPC